MILSMALACMMQDGLCQDPPPHPQEREERAALREVEWTWRWFPSDVLYRNYFADPLTPRSGTKFMVPLRAGPHMKIETALGSQRTIARSSSDDGRSGVELGVEGAVITRFDFEEAWDMDAADYRFGFPFCWRDGPWSAKIHIWHLTSHLGDEFISREDAKAIRYHKEELAFGLSRDLGDWRLYSDIGYGVYLGSPNEPWKFEAGVEWVGRPFGAEGPRVFAACDIKWREETRFDTAVCVQAGFWLVEESTVLASGMRVFAEYYRGKAAQTQFPDERNSYWSIGFAAGF